MGLKGLRHVLFWLFPEYVLYGTGVKRLVINTCVYFFSWFLGLFVPLDDFLVSELDEVFFVLWTVLEVDDPECYASDKEQNNNA